MRVPMTATGTGGAKRTYTVADILWRKRIDYGYRSIRQMAQELGCPVQTLWVIMDGKRHEKYCPKMEMFWAICRTLDIAPEVLSTAAREGWTPRTGGIT